MIPKLEDNIPKLQKQLVDEEKVLEEIEENSKGAFFLFPIFEKKFVCRLESIVVSSFVALLLIF